MKAGYRNQFYICPMIINALQKQSHTWKYCIISAITNSPSSLQKDILGTRFQLSCSTVVTTNANSLWGNRLFRNLHFLFKINNGNTIVEMCEIFSKLIINTLERCHWNRSGDFIVNFKRFHTMYNWYIIFRTVTGFVMEKVIPYLSRIRIMQFCPQLYKVNINNNYYKLKIYAKL